MSGRWAGLATALALTACSGAAAPTTPPPVTLGPENVVRVATGTVVAGPGLTGTLQPRRVATLRAEVPGPVREVRADRGEEVEEGEVVAVIDDAALRDRLRAARSAVRSAGNGLQLAREEEARSRRLAAAGGIATRDLDRARAAVQAQLAALAEAQAQVAVVEKELARTRVHAPFAGILSARQVNPGDIAQLGTALFTLVDPSSLRLEAQLPAERLDELKPGTPVDFRVTGYGERVFRGRVQRVEPVVDAATGQVRVVAELPNEGPQLLGGLSAQGRLLLDSQQAPVAPLDTVDFTSQSPSVLRVREGRVERVPVELGLRDEVAGRVAFARGVEEGDVLVRASARGAVADGSKVRLAAPRPDERRARTPPRP